MCARKIQQQRDGLEKLLNYILGHQPDEFGLYPDAFGFVVLKDLLAALHDEEGWRWVRERALFELSNQPNEAGSIEIIEKKIRLKPELAELPPNQPRAEIPPKFLYYGVANKAWVAINEKGLAPRSSEEFLILWTDEEQALRVARRRDHKAILITVDTMKIKTNIEFYPYSKRLWLTKDFINSNSLSGPNIKLVEEVVKSKKTIQVKEKADIMNDDNLVDSKNSYKKDKPFGEKKSKDGPQWKQEAKKDRRRRQKEEVEEW